MTAPQAATTVSHNSHMQVFMTPMQYWQRTMKKHSRVFTIFPSSPFFYSSSLPSNRRVARLFFSLSLAKHLFPPPLLTFRIANPSSSLGKYLFSHRNDLVSKAQTTAKRKRKFCLFLSTLTHFLFVLLDDVTTDGS
jgi:hypothetical protein